MLTPTNLKFQQCPRFPFLGQTFDIELWLVNDCGKLQMRHEVPFTIKLGFEDESEASCDLFEIVAGNRKIEMNGKCNLKVKLLDVSASFGDSKFVFLASPLLSEHSFVSRGVSSAMTCIKHRLVVENRSQIPTLWFKDKGGKHNCIEMVVKLSDEKGQAVCRSIPLKLQLCYSTGEIVSRQNILELSRESKLQINEEGYTSLKVRINEVSMRHDGKCFSFLISPDTLKDPKSADVSPVSCCHVEVRSKITIPKNKRGLDEEDVDLSLNEEEESPSKRKRNETYPYSQLHSSSSSSSSSLVNLNSSINLNHLNHLNHLNSKFHLNSNNLNSLNNLNLNHIISNKNNLNLNNNNVNVNNQNNNNLQQIKQNKQQSSVRFDLSHQNPVNVVSVNNVNLNNKQTTNNNNSNNNNINNNNSNNNTNSNSSEITEDLIGWTTKVLNTLNQMKWTETGREKITERSCDGSTTEVSRPLFTMSNPNQLIEELFSSYEKLSHIHPNLPSPNISSLSSLSPLSSLCCSENHQIIMNNHGVNNIDQNKNNNININNVNEENENEEDNSEGDFENLEELEDVVYPENSLSLSLGIVDGLI